MVPSLTTALNVVLSRRDAPTFVEPIRRRVAVVPTAVLLGAVLTFGIVTRLGIGDPGTFAVAYVVIFALIHAPGLPVHLIALAGERTEDG